MHVSYVQDLCGDSSALNKTNQLPMGRERV